MKVALYQFNPEFGQIDKNINAVMKAADSADFDILVLPEFFATGYQFKSADEAKELSDPAGEGLTFERIRKLASDKEALVVYGFPELGETGLYNSAAAIQPNGSYFIYRKTHLFDTEKAFFNPGDTGFFVFEFRNTMIGMMICFDWRFPEAARKLAVLGAQIICHPSNLVLPHCPDAMITRALENNIYTITANRIGMENRTGSTLSFIGRSRIVSPGGEIVGELGPDDTGLVVCTIDPETALEKSINPRNDIMRDRRPDYY